jgi:hypothetical protein
MWGCVTRLRCGYRQSKAASQKVEDNNEPFRPNKSRLAKKEEKRIFSSKQKPP